MPSSLYTFMFFVDGLTGGEASRASFIKRLASGLAAQWDRSYSDVLSWVRAKLEFALVRATCCVCVVHGPLEILRF